MCAHKTDDQTQLDAARVAGWENGLKQDGRPCFNCLKDIFWYSDKEAAAWAGGHFQACRARGGHPQITCGCWRDSPFKS